MRGKPADPLLVRFALQLQHDELPRLRFGDRDGLHGKSVSLVELCELPDHVLRNRHGHAVRLLRGMRGDRELHRDVVRAVIRLLL